MSVVPGGAPGGRRGPSAPDPPLLRAQHVCISYSANHGANRTFTGELATETTGDEDRLWEPGQRGQDSAGCFTNLVKEEIKVPRG